MTTLPTCPREDCTASDRHYHLVRTGGAMPCPDCYAPRPPQPQPAPVVLPTVDEAAEAVNQSMRDGGWTYRTAARAVLDLIAARLPVWQPVEPGAVIKAGPLYRIEWCADDTEGRSAVERTYAGGFTIDPTDPARFYVDPRTVPAEPVDPRVAVVADVLAEEYGSFDEDARHNPREYHRAAIDKILARIDAARADS